MTAYWLGGTPTPENERFGAAADTRTDRADQDVIRAGIGQGDRADLADPGLAQPEPERVVPHRPHLLCAPK